MHSEVCNKKRNFIYLFIYFESEVFKYYWKELGLYIGGSRYVCLTAA